MPQQITRRLERIKNGKAGLRFWSRRSKTTITRYGNKVGENENV
jgi:hypothetical protein